jgi:alkylhydroperoxidase family enzyme
MMRLNYREVFPDALKAMLGLERVANGGLAVWREADCFGPEERAALAWCDAVTLLPDSGAPDELYDELSCHFTSQQVVALTLAIVAINGWNRLNVAFRTPVAAARLAQPPAA